MTFVESFYQNLSPVVDLSPSDKILSLALKMPLFKYFICIRAAKTHIHFSGCYVKVQNYMNSLLSWPAELYMRNIFLGNLQALFQLFAPFSVNKNFPTRRTKEIKIQRCCMLANINLNTQEKRRGKSYMHNGASNMIFIKR